MGKTTEKAAPNAGGMHNTLVYVKQHWQLYLFFLLPAFLLTIIFRYIPMGGLVMLLIAVNYHYLMNHYPDGGGSLTVSFAFDPASDEVTLTFTDNGIPFNPLNAPEPDIKNVEDRKEGGMGIFLVRKFSDKLQYQYSGGKNILTITKKRLSKSGK